MTADESGDLVIPRDAGEIVADPGVDVRGRTVIDVEGRAFGRVTALLIDAVIGIGAHDVRIEQTLRRVAGAPPHQPGLVAESAFSEDTCGYYGYQPFWGPGYACPVFPRSSRTAE